MSPAEVGPGWLSRKGVTPGVALLAAARFFESLAFGVLIPILPLQVARLEGGAFAALPVELRTGVLFACFGLANTAAQYPFGVLTDRLGRPRLQISLGIGLVSLLSLSLLAVQTFAGLLAVRTVQAVIFALVLPALWVVLAAQTRAGRRGTGIGFYSTVQMLGFALGPLAGGWVAEAHGFGAAFVLCAGLGGISSLLMALFLEDGVPSAEPDPAPSADARLREIWVLGCAVFAMMFGISMIIALFPRYERTLGAGASDISLVFSMMVLARFLLQIPLGWLSDRWGRKPFILGGLVCLAPALLAVGLAGSLRTLVLARAAQGACAAAILTACYALVGDRTRAGARGRRFAAITMGFSGGSALGPLACGALVPLGAAVPFTVGAAGCLVMAAVVALVVREAPGPTPRSEDLAPPALP